MRHCALCGCSLPETGQFCPNCGVSLGLTCTKCGAENNPHALRCGGCGSSLKATTSDLAAAARPPRESRRIVTVLFADIVGYTSLVETHEETEVVRTLVREYFNALSNNILDHGGIVEKFIGDAICALFGAPVVHEDDPQRALACALSMQRTMERLNDGKPDDGTAAGLTLRIGVSTGEVVGGTAEQAGQEQYSVTGDAVNTASRLQSAAQPGQILVSGPTEQIARAQFIFESVGSLKLKGKRTGVSTFALVDARREVERSDGNLVNRRRELEHLGYCLGLASEGSSQLVEITGDAGVGKSRLVEAFTESTRNALLCRGDCPTSMGQPLHPFVSVARALLASVAVASEDETLSDSVNVLNEMIAGSASVTGNQSDDVADAIQNLIRHHSKHGVVLVVIENVHRADPDSLDVLQRLIHRVTDERLLLLWTRRTGEDQIVNADLLAEFTRISLRPLTDADANEMMCQLLGAVSIPDALGARIVERSGGNPLYIDAMIRTILEDVQAIDSGDLLEVDIPTTVQGLVQARLDSLPEAERLVAQEAAVAGREFDARLLERVDLFGVDVEPALEALARRGVVDHVGGSTYRFRHVLTQEVCYETMLQGLRSELHREIADAVADVYPERAIELAPYRADHYAKAGDTDRAVDILVEAGVSET